MHSVVLMLTAVVALTAGAARGEPAGSPRRLSRHPERRGLSLLPLDSLGLRGAQEPVLDPRRSLAVTDEAILSRFSFEEVMTRLAQQAGVPGLTALGLYQEWWDSQRRAPGLGESGPHCDDQKLADGTTGFNGFPYACPRSEGNQAKENPFSAPDSNPGAYVPIGLFNRFDLAALDGSDCGEYRILFARRSGLTSAASRNLIIFESVLPNPSPGLGLAGCRDVMRFWAQLSQEPSAAARAEALHHFYFEGLEGFAPLVHVDRLGNDPHAPTGQVRTNQFMQALWTLREFRVRKSCAGASCTLRFEPDTVKTHPAGMLFSAKKTHPLKEDFAALLVSQAPVLVQGDVLHFSLALEERFNSAQSRSSGTDDLYTYQLGKGASPLRTQLQERLTTLGSPLTPDQLVARMQTLSCAGCHQFSTGVNLGGGVSWPGKSTAFEFVHVSERVHETGPDGPRYGLSEALVGTFLPARQRLMEAFLAGRLPSRPPSSLGAGAQ